MARIKPGDFFIADHSAGAVHRRDICHCDMVEGRSMYIHIVVGANAGQRNLYWTQDGCTQVEYPPGKRTLLRWLDIRT